MAGDPGPAGRGGDSCGCTFTTLGGRSGTASHEGLHTAPDNSGKVQHVPAGSQRQAGAAAAGRPRGWGPPLFFPESGL